ncbi:MAG: hypothetical protein ABJ251_15065 [Paracoccaceae bacterium]
MKHALISAMVLTALSMTAAYAGKAGAPNQSQPTSSVVTPNAAAAAFQNAIASSSLGSSVTVTSLSPNGVATVNIQAGGRNIPATVQQISAGQFTVTFADGSTSTFNLSDLR